MCGIVFSADFTGKSVNNRILDQYFKQKHRGSQGFGLYDRMNNKIVTTPKEKKVLSYLKNHDSTEVLFHHRWPTSTENVKSACHPFHTGDKFTTRYVMVHNGIIQNAETLKKDHDAAGIVYQSMQPDGKFNDSEALLWDLALYLEDKKQSLDAAGSIAFICIALGLEGKDDVMYFGRNTNPLNLNLKEGEKMLLSSEGSGVAIKAHTLHKFDYGTHIVTESPLVIPSGVTKIVYPYSDYDYEDDATFYGDGNYNTKKASQRTAWDDEFEELINESEEFDDYTPAISNDALEHSTDITVIKTDIQHRYRAYMDLAKGNFFNAYDNATKDTHYLKVALLAYRLEGSEQKNIKDTEYEIEIQNCVTGVMLMHPEWHTVDSVSSEYKKLVTAGLFDKHPVSSDVKSTQQIIAEKVLDAKAIKVRDLSQVKEATGDDNKKTSK